jgi:hypothetical protein
MYHRDGAYRALREMVISSSVLYQFSAEPVEYGVRFKSTQAVRSATVADREMIYFFIFVSVNYSTTSMIG